MSRQRGWACDKRSQQRATTLESENPNSFFCIGCSKSHDLGDGHRHHVVPHVDGGLSEKWNCLTVCSSCHVMLHGGTQKDQERIHVRVYCYMAATYGILFLLQYQSYCDVIRENAKKAPLSLKEYRKFNEVTKELHYRELLHQMAPGVVTFGGLDPYRSIFPQ